jgi:hypothetical protein
MAYRARFSNGWTIIPCRDVKRQAIRIRAVGGFGGVSVRAPLLIIRSLSLYISLLHVRQLRAMPMTIFFFLPLALTLPLPPAPHSISLTVCMRLRACVRACVRAIYLVNDYMRYVFIPVRYLLELAVLLFGSPALAIRASKVFRQYG